ncbi:MULTISPECIES: DUF3275 family protein [unclassified Serratia (in: enterobacteria)]|uniref:DUF3275 family protein n=1 Tax=unclassified Serratia (in: enterobacteria) TaxID=2647522 RepID=UPI00307676E7
MITIPGQLAIRTIHGRNGPFNVGRLATSIGEFVIKNAELDQYDEGKYDGEFIITEIRPSTYNTSGRMVIEIRAHLGGMTLSSTEQLSENEASQFSPQEVDPLDEEPSAPAMPPQPTDLPVVSTDPLIDTTPFGVPDASPGGEGDETLFGALWPLTAVVKLDTTVDRRCLRAQGQRLRALGYTFDEIAQEWRLAVTA